MKKLIGLLFLGLLLTACGEPQPDFHVAVTLVDSENSEDSNSTTRSVKIDGYEARYTWQYSGYSPDTPPPDEKWSITLTEEDLQALTLLVRENGLMVSRDATVSSNDPWHSFDVTWTASMGGQSASGHVVGEQAYGDPLPTDDFADDESKFAAEAVLDFIESKHE